MCSRKGNIGRHGGLVQWCTKGGMLCDAPGRGCSCREFSVLGRGGNIWRGGNHGDGIVVGGDGVFAAGWK